MLRLDTEAAIKRCCNTYQFITIHSFGKMPKLLSSKIRPKYAAAPNRKNRGLPLPLVGKASLTMTNIRMPEAKLSSPTRNSCVYPNRLVERAPNIVALDKIALVGKSLAT
mgnify:CR=1 FL=1